MNETTWRVEDVEPVVSTWRAVRKVEDDIGARVTLQLTTWERDADERGPDGDATLEAAPPGEPGSFWSSYPDRIILDWKAPLPSIGDHFRLTVEALGIPHTAEYVMVAQP